MTPSSAVLSPLITGLRTCLSLLCLAVVIATSGCAVTDRAQRSDAKAVAIVAMVAADGVETAFSRASMVSRLEGALDAQGKPPLSNRAVARELGGDRLALISGELERHGSLSDESMQMLMATRLPTRRALLVRLERNEVTSPDPATAPIRDESGRVLPDRHDVIRASRRDMRVAATLLDLNTGQPVWERAWSAAPATTVRYVNYSGDSFTGSVAATLANTVVNGLRAPEPPAAPGERETLDALLAQVANELP